MRDDSIPRNRCLSLSDFHDFGYCVFRFFVNHHLGKRYELASGNQNQTIGSLLDLTVKNIHSNKAYTQPLPYFKNILKASERQIKESIAKKGPLSFYGAHKDFLTEETLEKAWEIFQKYYLGVEGKFKTSIIPDQFWKRVIVADEKLMIWGGGPDAVEFGEDEIPEVVDYKYYENTDSQIDKFDMDLMPKIDIFLASQELLKIGYKKARFVLRFWEKPGDESMYEEFDLTTMDQLEQYLKTKAEKILRTDSLSFCEKDFCKACKSELRDQWIAQLQLQGFIKPIHLEGELLGLDMVKA